MSDRSDMDDATPDDMLRRMMEWEGEVAAFEITREDIEDGRTFSAEALQQLHAQMTNFVGTRVMRRWDSTGEPPTALLVEIKVSVS